MTDRRKKIQGGIFSRTNDLPERDSEDLTQRMHQQRPPHELAEIDRQIERRERNQFGAFHLTDTGLSIEGSATLEDWREAGAYIFAFQGAVQWLIGDWLAFGEKHQWGDIKKIARERGQNYQSLRMYAHVSRNVFMRINTLTWNHHLLVAKLPEDRQREALEYAAQNNLTVKDFRLWLRGDPPPLPPATSEITDRRAKEIMREMAKIEQMPPEKRKEKHITLYRGYIAAFEQYIAEKKKWLEQGGAGEG